MGFYVDANSYLGAAFLFLAIVCGSLQLSTVWWIKCDSMCVGGASSTGPQFVSGRMPVLDAERDALSGT